MTRVALVDFRAILIAGARFALDQDGGVRPSHLFNLGEDALHGMASADDLLVRILELDFFLQAIFSEIR